MRYTRMMNSVLEQFGRRRMMRAALFDCQVYLSEGPVDLQLGAYRKLTAYLGTRTVSIFESQDV